MRNSLIKFMLLIAALAAQQIAVSGDSVSSLHLITCFSTLESADFTAQQRQKQCATKALSTMQLSRKAVKADTIFGNA